MRRITKRWTEVRFQHGYNPYSCDLGKSAMLTAQLYTPYFRASCSSGSENYNIVGSRVHYTLQSKSTYYIQNKILSLHSWLVKGWQLWIQSVTLKLMKTGWKKNLKHQEGDEGIPSKGCKLGALILAATTDGDAPAPTNASLEKSTKSAGHRERASRAHPKAE